MEVRRCGPSGGNGGHEFADDAIVPGERVSEVRIRAGRTVDAVQIIHKNASGARHEFSQHGDNGGDLHVFTLDENEFITGISGRFGATVDSISIHTTRQSSPRFGGGGGNADYHYECPEDCEIVGFLGRAGRTLDAIGVIMRRHV
jgi:hypothetical protein